MPTAVVRSDQQLPVEGAAVVKKLGTEAGFDLVHIAAATALIPEGERHVQWIEDGRQGEMQWMTAQRAKTSSRPASVLADAASVVCVGLSYWSGHRPRSENNHGKVARYAWGSDYHAVLGERLTFFVDKLVMEFGGKHKWYVDTGPLMDKALAGRSGLGFYGKNTNILTERFGSFVLLGEIVTTLELQPDEPLQRGCGSCRLCMVACPTGALGPEYSIDSRKCISYLTIEHRSAIPRELRDKMGAWVFGCDICQDVCPPTMEPHLSTKTERLDWVQEVRSHIGKSKDQLNRNDPTSSLYTVPPPSNHVARVLRPRTRSGHNAVPPHNPLFETRKTPAVDLIWLLQLTHAQYLEAFRGTAIRRAKDWMLRRNAAVALGNTGTEDAIQPLKASLESDEHSVVRGHAAWALGKLANRLNNSEVRIWLSERLKNEPNPEVRLEIQAALPKK